MGNWEKELKWAKEVWNGKPLMSAEEALKFYAVNGCEIADDNDDLASSCTEQIDVGKLFFIPFGFSFMIRLC